MVEILSLVLQHDEQAVLVAVEMALQAGVPTKTHILNLLHRLGELMPEDSARGSGRPRHAVETRLHRVDAFRCDQVARRGPFVHREEGIDRADKHRRTSQREPPVGVDDKVRSSETNE
jgi:hypothetical protein